tara:strand:- start:3 stop:197 length:195 start_codon:yes stop_codon:yes gene_type:complete
MNLEVNKKQLELLKFMVLHFECNDNEEKELIEQLEESLYNLEEKEALKLMGIMKAQEKHPEPEW